MEGADPTVGFDSLFCPRCGVRFPPGTARCSAHDSNLLPVGRGDDLSGTLLRDKYLLVRLLGSGAYGSVYLALHRLAQASVAIKVLHDDRQAEPLARKQFLKEARALMRIQTPHAVIVRDVDEDEAGRLFLVMELLKGVDLGKHVERVSPSDRRLPWAEAVRMAIQVCEALDEAHACGVVHRDLKPANVMVVESRDGRPDVKVVDFGVARVTSLTDTGNTTTETMVRVAGTPAYMSPEQCRGLDVDGRSDLYGLGVMLYELLSGRRPFQTNTSAAMMIAHATETPVPLLRAFPDLRLPADLDHLVTSLLAKNPADRPRSAAETARLLRGIREAPREPGPPDPNPPPRPIRKRSIWPWVLVALIAVTLASIGIWWSQRPEETTSGVAGTDVSRVPAAVPSTVSPPVPAPAVPVSSPTPTPTATTSLVVAPPVDSPESKKPAGKTPGPTKGASAAPAVTAPEPAKTTPVSPTAAAPAPVSPAVPPPAAVPVVAPAEPRTPPPSAAPPKPGTLQPHDREFEELEQETGK